MHLLGALFALTFPLLMVAAALSDITTMTIPNRLTGALALAFAPAALLCGLPLPMVLEGVGVGAAALLLGALMFALKWIGGGDAKLLAGAGLWLGLAGAPTFLTWTAMAGGLFGLGLIMARSWAQPYAGFAPRWVARLLEPRGDIPYGVAIAVGGLAAFPQSLLVQKFLGVI